jgi:pimeloyl-ACP methyl ester carboxylesterase
MRTISAMALQNPYAELIAATPVLEGAASVLGSDTHYWDYGPTDATVTIVAVHGFRGEHHGLEPIVVRLPGVRVISPDLPGFGASTPMTEARHDIDGYARWLGAFVDALDLPARPVILGHSFGSIVVAAAVAGGPDNPKSISPELITPKLILINPIAAPALHGPKAFITSLAVFYYWAGAKLPRPLGNLLLGSRVITRFISQVMVTADTRDLRRWIHDQHRTYFSRFADRDTLLEGFRASTGNNVIEYAPRITVPTLLIAAGNDPITKVADEEKLRDLLSDATLYVLPNVGHLIHYERPAEAAKLILEFLGSTAKSTTGRTTTRKSTTG